VATTNEKREIYISVDIETTGPIPGEFSMLSLGGVAFAREADGTTIEVAEFYEKLAPLDAQRGHRWDQNTLDWWLGYPDILREALADPKPPEEVMHRFVAWARTLGGDDKVTLVASPAGFDGMFVNWYAVRSTGLGYDRLPWKHRVLDLRTYAAATLRIPYHDAHESAIAKMIDFEPSVPHNHVAVQDAREQGETFMALLRHNLARDANQPPERP